MEVAQGLILVSRFASPALKKPRRSPANHVQRFMLLRCTFPAHRAIWRGHNCEGVDQRARFPFSE